MIVLDTNVVSELLRHRPEAAVTAWVDSIDRRDLYITTVTMAELLVGTASLPAGRRRDQLAHQVELVISEDFDERVLSFDPPAARCYPGVRLGRQAMGRPVGAADAQIAAICLSYGAALATRNTRDFDGVGVEVIDPWVA